MIVVVWATVYAVSEAINESSTFNPELGIWLHGVVWAPQGEEYVQDLPSLILSRSRMGMYIPEKINVT